ncbi:site-2 protease family protein [Streptomyces sp. MNU89]|uniref:site-2 protease family protein n=1 Tax=Streptomyces sp. MNU89 TaxID=2560025 RepID=UPI001E3730D7|nr:site-2 protease family protein [Streptomyces sp. MNU89]MCC9738693.1 peptidase M50 [Streptomyces sp. MNU89]
MTAPAAVPRRYRPELRAGVLVGGALLHGPATVHLIKNTESGLSFKVGEKEHFLISRMDGSRSLEELGAEYAARYGRRLADANWQQLLGMLGARGLLAGAPAGSGGGPGARPGPGPGPEAGPDTPPAAGPQAPPERKLLSGSIRLVADADATTGRLHRAAGFLLRPLWMVPLLCLAVVMEAVLAARLGELVLGARALFLNPVLLTAAGTLLWLSTALHELAHGVVARHYGGRVSEIGLRWRLPVVIMYCTVDDYLHLGTRAARIATAAAGAVMNLLFLLPFWTVWMLAPVDDATGDALAGLLFLGSVQALAMLIPLPPLDGYKIASQLLGATGLAASSKEYLGLAVRRNPAAAAYPSRARTAYLLYGLGAPLVLAALAAALAVLVHFLLTAP